MITTCGLFVILDNKILAVHPTNHEWDQWDIPKGCNEDNEDRLTTALREFKEECGINLLEDDYIDTIVLPEKTYKYKHRNKQLYPILLKLKRPFDKILKCESMVDNKAIKPYPFPEVDAYTWIEYSQRQALHITQIKALEDFQKKLNIFKEKFIEKNYRYG